MHIDVHIIEEAGYESARRGLGLNKKTGQAAHRTCKILSQMDGGHNKFLESIYMWVEVRAPRYWWSQADTYRLSSKQSESTMHTLVKEVRTLENAEQETQYIRSHFEDGEILEQTWNILLEYCKDESCELRYIKGILPEGYLQSRVWCMSYKTLRNIIQQRRKHKLPHWQEFCKQMKAQVEHPEFLP